jgi:hypothetical protein
VFGDFIKFVEDMCPNSLIGYHVSPVLSNKHEMVVTKVYRVVGSYVFFLHVITLPHGEHELGVAPSPGLRHGVLRRSPCGGE